MESRRRNLCPTSSARLSASCSHHSLLASSSSPQLVVGRRCFGYTHALPRRRDWASGDRGRLHVSALILSGDGVLLRRRLHASISPPAGAADNGRGACRLKTAGAGMLVIVVAWRVR